MIKAIYSAIGGGTPQPIPLAEIDDVARLIDRFTETALQL